jgi:hypothetical protein
MSIVKSYKNLENNSVSMFTQEVNFIHVCRWLLIYSWSIEQQFWLPKLQPKKVKYNNGEIYKYSVR